MIKSQFYPIGYEEHQQIVWHYFRQRQGQSVQEFTTEFRKREIQMGVSLKSPDMLVKYLGALLPHIHRKMMLFRPKTIDEANIQAQYLEGDKQKQQTNPHKQVEPQEQRRERRKTRRSGMRRRLWQKHKKKHLPSNNVKDVIERDTLRRIVGNCTLRSTPNIFRKRRRKH
jgi:hypothetical protein